MPRLPDPVSPLPPRSRRRTLAGCARSLLPVAAAALLLGQSGWRLDGSGQFPGATPPVAWSASEGVVWKTALNVWSNASPVLAGDRLFVCEEPSTLVCVDRASGAVLWRAPNEITDLAPEGVKSAAEAAERMKVLQEKERELRAEERAAVMDVASWPGHLPYAERLLDVRARLGAVRRETAALQSVGVARPVTHDTNGYSSPTPVWDGRFAYALFGTGVAVCFDREGRRVWGRFVGPVTHGWGHSASPVLAGGKLVLHLGPKVYALDPASSEILWSSPSNSNWGTPMPLDIGGEAALVTAGGDILRVSDGKLLAALGGLPWTSPLADRGVLYFADETGAAAHRLPSTLSEPFQTAPLWRTDIRRDRYYASPVVHEGLLYAMTQGAHLTVLDAATGAVVYERDLNLGGTAYPSFSLAGGRLYVSGDTGVTAVLRPGRTYEELARNQLEPFRSTPVFAGTRIYVRALKHLYCLGT